MKLTEKKINEIKELKKSGLTLSEISRKVGLHYSTISYHTNDEYKLKSQERSIQRIHNLGKRRIKEINKKNYDSEYFTNRYRTNQEHRKAVLNNMFLMREKRKKKGLCPSCGNNRKSKKWILCEKCRKIKRDKYVRKK